mmetsp:Transcript_7945/g.23241  ORF Transcript_7945/g.23241 Transcript_7945/m.23241 type:complete len:241 (-) Transcript_7945:158-880(-)
MASQSPSKESPSAPTCSAGTPSVAGRPLLRWVGTRPPTLPTSPLLQLTPRAQASPPSSPTGQLRNGSAAQLTPRRPLQPTSPSPPSSSPVRRMTSHRRATTLSSFFARCPPAVVCASRCCAAPTAASPLHLAAVLSKAWSASSKSPAASRHPSCRLMSRCSLRRTVHSPFSSTLLTVRLRRRRQPPASSPRASTSAPNARLHDPLGHAAETRFKTHAPCLSVRLPEGMQRGTTGRPQYHH